MVISSVWVSECVCVFGVVCCLFGRSVGWSLFSRWMSLFLIGWGVYVGFGLKTRAMNLLIVTRLVGDVPLWRFKWKIVAEVECLHFFCLCVLRLNHWTKGKNSTNFAISFCWLCHFVQMLSGNSAFIFLSSKKLNGFFLSHRRCLFLVWVFFLFYSFI